MKKTTAIGKEGENTAIKYLFKNEYTVIFTNYHSRFGEIDVIATKGDFLIFIEVKKRKTINYGHACEYVTVSKQRKIIKTAMYFLQENDFDLQPRFDVIEVYEQNINHIKSAFECN